MKKISIKLNQDYKQFKKGFNYELNGDLIIISGVNGSGKSQLVDILNKSQFIEEGISNIDLDKKYINSEISIDDNPIDMVSISRRSFRENVNINNIKTPAPKNSQWHKNEAWKNFSNYNSWNEYTNEYSKSKAIIEKILRENGFKIKPEWNSSKSNNTDTFISKEDFIKLLPDNFIWEKDDIFSNRIDELFYEFAVKRNLEQIKYSTRAEIFNNDKYIKDAPWTILNELFKKLNFNYRFKNDYIFEAPNFKEDIMIYPVIGTENRKEEIDLKSPRELCDLSDGEKSIISLTFALLNEKRRPIEKLILLDEFDNTLNPSLIEALFKVIEDYFISKGVVVIMTTHSPVTISMAPEYASYYEMFKQENDSPKIIAVDKYQYSELKISNRNFYDKIRNPSLRMKELEGENRKLKEKINNLVMPLIITEGKTDWKHIKNAKEQLNDTIQYEFFESFDDMGDIAVLNMLKEQAKICNSNKRIFIFDNDNNTIVNENIADNGKKYKNWGNNVYSFIIPKPGIRKNEEKISIEHYYTDEILKKEIICPDSITRRIYCGNDFQSTGLNKALNKRCNKKEVCGNDKIRVLSGSGQEKVFDLDNEDNNSTNYALSKDDFFEKIIKLNNNVDLTSFKLILDIIKEIVEEI